MFENGQIIDGNYRIEDKIGSGGGGIIYKAYQISMQRYVALKLIKENVKDLISERSEADILKKLKHENLPAVYDFLHEDRDVYTVMEFIEGTDFDKLIKKGKRFTEDEVIGFAIQLCDAVSYLHNQNPPIIHSDIKPANIMLMSGGKICLIDFNISTYLNSNVTAAIGHSKHFAALEQTTDYIQIVDNPVEPDAFSEETRYVGDETVLNTEYESEMSTAATSYKKSYIDMRTDVYGMGATLYFIATGRFPEGRHLDFSGTGISKKLQKVLNHATQILPEKRYKTVNLFKKDLLNIKNRRFNTLKKVAAVVAVAIVGAVVFENYMLNQKTTIDDYQENVSEYTFVILGEQKYDKSILELNLSELADSIKAKDLSVISELKSLRKLNLDGINLAGEDLSYLSDVDTLEVISMKGCHLEDADFLANNTSLTSIDISDNAVKSLDFVSSLSSLETLVADNNALGNNITALSDAKKLKTLYVDNNNITDISCFSGMVSLRELTFNFNGVSDISALSGLTDLERIDMSQNNISDISALASLTGMVRLNFSENYNISDISALKDMNNLETLFCGRNNIRDISVLKGKTKLVNLVASSNNISDISPLADCTHIAMLGISSNDIDDISPLENLNEIVQLSLPDNSITDISVLSGKKSLAKLDIRLLKLDDISCLVTLEGLEKLQISAKYVNSEQLDEVSSMLSSSCEIQTE